LLIVIQEPSEIDGAKTPLAFISLNKEDFYMKNILRFNAILILMLLAGLFVSQTSFAANIYYLNNKTSQILNVNNNIVHAGEKWALNFPPGEYPGINVVAMNKNNTAFYFYFLYNNNSERYECNAGEYATYNSDSKDTLTITQLSLPIDSDKIINFNQSSSGHISPDLYSGIAYTINGKKAKLYFKASNKGYILVKNQKGYYCYDMNYIINKNNTICFSSIATMQGLTLKINGTDSKKIKPIDTFKFPIEMSYNGGLRNAKTK
jgi:hypothetical protein